MSLGDSYSVVKLHFMYNKWWIRSLTTPCEGSASHGETLQVNEWVWLQWNLHTLMPKMPDFTGAFVKICDKS